MWNLPQVNLKYIDYEKYTPTYGQLQCGEVFNKLLHNINTKEHVGINADGLLLKPKICNYKSYLDVIKSKNPNYPVYKTFRILFNKYLSKTASKNVPPTNGDENKAKESTKKKRGRPKKKKQESLDISVGIIEESTKDCENTRCDLWTDTYKPSSSEEIFGNKSSVTELKKWLELWIEFSKEISAKRRIKKHSNSDSSSEFETTDGDSRDSVRLPRNAMILSGPNGSGKTSAVYAICNELDINILELNASSKRTGKFCTLNKL